MGDTVLYVLKWSGLASEGQLQTGTTITDLYPVHPGEGTPAIVIALPRQ